MARSPVEVIELWLNFHVAWWKIHNTNFASVIQECHQAEFWQVWFHFQHWKYNN